MNVNPAVEPAVTDAAVRSTVEGAQTAAGSVTLSVGNELTVTVADPEAVFTQVVPVVSCTC